MARASLAAGNHSRWILSTARFIVSSGGVRSETRAPQAGGTLSRPRREAGSGSAGGRRENDSDPHVDTESGTCWLRGAPRMTSGCGSTTFGSSAVPRGPVALRPSLAAGLPLSRHREGGGEYCRIARGQVRRLLFLLWSRSVAISGCKQMTSVRVVECSTCPNRARKGAQNRAFGSRIRGVPDGPPR